MDTIVQLDYKGTDTTFFIADDELRPHNGITGLAEDRHGGGHILGCKSVRRVKNECTIRLQGSSSFQVCGVKAMSSFGQKELATSNIAC